jgi:uncharacterized protein
VILSSREKDLLEEKKQHLHQLMQSYGRLAIAYSGGVDSTLLLKCAFESLGAGNVLVLHSRSCLEKPGECDQAMGRLAELGLSDRVEQEIIDLQPLAWKDFVVNPPERCYLCKLRVYNRFLEIAESKGFHLLADGTNSDDLKDSRPGLRAIHELGVKTPLVETGFTKEEVRALSQRYGLTIWNRPSSSCLATRIPAGLEITLERLAKIVALEAILVNLGFDGCRVRLDLDSNSTVLLQVREDDFSKILMKSLRFTVIHSFRKEGIENVYLDLVGR